MRVKPVIAVGTCNFPSTYSPIVYEQYRWFPQAPARYLTLHYDRREEYNMVHCCIQVDSISISWTGWHRIDYHVHW